MPTLPPALRLALVPFGAAIAAQGLSYYADAEKAARARLADLELAAAAHEAYLAGTGPRPEVDDEDQFVDEWTATATVRPRRRPVLAAAAVLGGVAAGIWLIRSAATRIRRADRDATDDKIRSARLRAQPPAPGAPVPTDPGCLHPRCILDHPHAGPAILHDPNDVDRPIPGGSNVVQHCNSETEYAMISHLYDPAGCGHCSKILQVARTAAARLRRAGREAIDDEDQAADESGQPVPYVCPYGCGWDASGVGSATARSLTVSLHANSCDARPPRLRVP
jgi:hypothetical protein